jgi:hypothetical protein
MKMSRIAVNLIGAALLFGSVALAGDVNKGTLSLSETVSVQGKTLTPGQYKVEWNGTGPDVQVSVLRGKDTVVSFPAHLTEQPVANTGNAYGSQQQPDGTRALTAIYIGGKHTVLELNSNGNSQTSSNQAGN